MKKKIQKSAIAMMFALSIVPMLFAGNAHGAVVSTSPENGATGVLVGTVVTVVFSEAMDPASVTKTAFFIKSGTGYGSDTVSGTVSYNEGDNTATFKPTSLLSQGETYTATVTKDVENAAGTPLGSDYTWSFTTTTATFIGSVSPGMNETGVDIEAHVIVSFSNAMNPSTINNTTFYVKAGTGYDLESLAGEVSYNEDDKTATFRPTFIFDYYTNYIATITTSAKDVNGNSMQTDYSWSFTTAEELMSGYIVISRSNVIKSPDDTVYALPMTVMLTDPDRDPIPNQAIYLQSWPVNYATGQWNNIGEIVDREEFPNEDMNRDMIFSPGEDLNADGELTPPYSATGFMPQSVTTDENGIADFELTYPKSSAAWIKAEITATTVETKLQVIEEFWLPYMKSDIGQLPDSPYNTITGDGPTVIDKSSTSKELTVTFSREMDPSSVMASLTVRVEIPGVGYGILAGEIKCEGTKATFTPYSGFIPGFIYSLVIFPDAKDMAGIPMDSGYSSSFVISAPETIKTIRDDKGVWFITGPDDATLFDVFEAMGYAVATDRLWQAEKFRRSARGRLAEIFGQDQLNTDIYMRTIGYSDQELQDAFDALDSESQSVIKGYASGFNRRIAEIRSDRSLLPFEFHAVGASLGIDFVPDDWTASDILAWESLMLRNFDPEGFESHMQTDNALLYQGLATKFPNDFQGMFEDLRWTNDPDALTYIPKDGSGKAKNRSSSKKISASAVPNIRQAAGNMVEIRNNVMEKLKKINAYVKMGSYAWTVAGTKTASGNPTIYSGPQMGFSTPSIIIEGSVRAGGLNVSGMAIPGLPGIILGRTPHHAWSMQVGHSHTVDYYLEDPSAVTLHRTETIKVAGQDDVLLPVFRTSHGPVINPIPFDPETYVADPENPIISWKYSHWGYELDATKGFLNIIRAETMDEFGEGIEYVAVSMHFCYADRDGNIAYWMSGRDPVRPAGEYRFPQGFIPGTVPLEWDSAVLIPRSTDRNTAQGFYSGWNNKTSAGYGNSYNNYNYLFGPFHRAHVIHEYLSVHDNLAFEELRDLALNIAATDSVRGGGNPWEFAKDNFISAVTSAGVTDKHQAALDLLTAWDGHFVAGGAPEWASGIDRSDGWILMDTWIREVIRLTFEDELGDFYASENRTILFNSILHGLAGESSGIVNNYNWFQNLQDETAPQTADTIIVAALDTVLAELGDQPWGSGERGEITYTHDLLEDVHTMPFSSRSTYAHCVEIGPSGPVRIESMFPLGESGTILMGTDGQPVFDEHFFSMTEVFDSFAHRDFPLFD